MKRDACIYIYKLLGLWALLVILTGCAAEKEPLITSPSSLERLTEPTPPEYPGGFEKLFEFIADNLRWPGDDDSCIQGRVVVLFTVEKDGSLSDIKVAKSLDPLFDKEAVRVVKSMPKWKPGKLNGKPVRTKFFIPISFRYAYKNN